MLKIRILILVLLPAMAIAQRNVDLDKYSFRVQLRSLPKMKVDSTYRTYNVEVENTKLMQSFIRDIDPARMVEIDGWRKLNQQGHVSIKVRIDDLLPESFTVSERSENIKDRLGKITGTRTFYSQEMTYTFAATAVVMDYKGAHIQDHVLATREHKYTFRSPEFPVRQMAEGYFLINSLKVTNDLFRINVTNAMNTLSDRISNDMGYGETTTSDYMWVVGSRKHAEYDGNRKAILLMNDVLFAMTPSVPITDARQKLKPAIDYFEMIKKRYNSSSKHDRKIRYASYFNLAVMYYYLDDPQSMMREANGLVLNDFDSKDGKGFESVALNLKNQMQNANVFSRHFPVDTTIFKGPYEQRSIVIGH
jgi:hypothetical protein